MVEEGTTRVGLSDEANINRHRRVLSSESNRVLEDIRAEAYRLNEMRNGFERKYGEDLFAYSLAFNRRNERLEGFAELRGELVETDLMIDSFGGLIESHIDWESQQNTERDRGEVMAEFLKDLAGLS